MNTIQFGTIHQTSGDDLERCIVEAFAYEMPVEMRRKMQAARDAFRASLAGHASVARRAEEPAGQASQAKPWWTRMPVWVSISAALACTTAVVWMASTPSTPERQAPTPTNEPAAVTSVSTNVAEAVPFVTTAAATCALATSTNTVATGIAANMGRIMGVVQKTDGAPVTGCLVFTITSQRERRIGSSDAPTDGNGRFTLSAIPAPGTYSFLFDPSFNYILERKDETIRVQPGETVACILTVVRVPKIYLKVRDIDGQPRLRFVWLLEAPGGHSANTTEMTTDAWLRIGASAARDLTTNVTVRIRVWNDKQLCDATRFGGMDPAYNVDCATTNVVLHRDAEDIYVIMQLSPPVEAKPEAEKELLASGWLKLEDGTPVSSGWIITFSGLERSVDDAGWFEIYGKKGDNEPFDMIDIARSTLSKSTSVIGITAGCADVGNAINWQTNIVKGTMDTIVYLPLPRSIRGRVYMGNHTTPATNFHVTVFNSSSSSKAVGATDGTFVCWVPQQNHHYTPLQLVVVGCPPFAPLAIPYDAIPGTELDMGDIVLTEQASSLYGRTVARDRGPIPAQVSLQHVFLDKSTKSDDMGGEYDFAGLTTGRYSIVATSGNATASNTVIITRFGETVTVPDIVLDPAAAE